jgi:hypothetical protein
LTVLLRDGGVNAKTLRILDTLSSTAVQSAWLEVRRWPDSTEVASRLLQLRNRASPRSPAYIFDPGFRRALIVDELALRGRLREAFDTLGTNIGRRESEPFGFLALFGGVPQDTASAVFARMLHDRSSTLSSALPWWATHRDTVSLAVAVVRADSELAAATNPVLRRNASYRVAVSRAYLSLGRHSDDALTRFRELPDSLCPACYVDRYVKARLLDSLGMHVEAENALGERLYSLLAPLEIPWALERALVAEKLQHYPAASRAYALVARAWSGGDGAQRAVAMQAATKAGQLGGDQTLPARVGNSSR